MRTATRTPTAWSHGRLQVRAPYCRSPRTAVPSCTTHPSRRPRRRCVVIEVTSGALDQFSRQATSATSLALIVVTVIAIAAGVFLFVRYREARRELRDMRKGGGGGMGGEP